MLPIDFRGTYITSKNIIQFLAANTSTTKLSLGGLLSAYLQIYEKISLGGLLSLLLKPALGKQVIRGRWAIPFLCLYQ